MTLVRGDVPRGAVVKRAVVSVHDKTGLAPFCAELVAMGVELVATGGTAAHLREHGIESADVSTFTGEPEALGGRIKTLSWRLLAGLLAREQDQDELESLGVPAVDAVVVNLYPFWTTASHRGNVEADELELIDIGGVTLLRAAAKNYPRVVVASSPSRYGEIARSLREDGCVPQALRLELAREAFDHVAWYDALISARFRSVPGGTPFPERLVMAGDRVEELRYGENPHQGGAVYRLTGSSGGIAGVRQLGGKQLSYNNLFDLDAAYSLVTEFQRPAAAIVKHGNPCGCAVKERLDEAYQRALAGDPMSAFGCIVGLNRAVDVATAQLIHETHFVEAVAAPAFQEEALPILRKKRNRRYVEVPASEGCPWQFRSILGGMLLQEPDRAWTGARSWRVTSQRKPSADQQRDLEFGWVVVKHVRSNAIVLVKDEEVVGVGAGQMSRVDSAHIAVRKAGERARGAVMASDAFLPMPDTLEVVAEAGVTALVEPGGSKGDPGVIEAADSHGMALLFTGRRHFRH
jgi:phosphoribosylaminoimidazolecarboxamide formyltransferase/IMP cyclohydrolase